MGYLFRNGTNLSIGDSECFPYGLFRLSSQYDLIAAGNRRIMDTLPGESHIPLVTLALLPHHHILSSCSRRRHVPNPRTHIVADTCLMVVFLRTHGIVGTFVICTVPRTSSKQIRLRFLLDHAGLLLALIGGFAGGADTTQWRLRISGNETAQEAFAPDGSTIQLKQALKLEKFTVTHYPNGIPENYEAQISINDKEVVLRVNEPYGLSLSDDLYLVDYEHAPAGETTRYCILEIVRQPWKYVEWAGIWMMITGSVLLFAQGVPSAKKRRATK